MTLSSFPSRPRLIKVDSKLPPFFFNKYTIVRRKRNRFLSGFTNCCLYKCLAAYFTFLPESSPPLSHRGYLDLPTPRNYDCESTHLPAPEELSHMKPQFFLQNPNVGDTNHLEDSRSTFSLCSLPLTLSDRAPCP